MAQKKTKQQRTSKGDKKHRASAAERIDASVLQLRFVRMEACRAERHGEFDKPTDTKGNIQINTQGAYDNVKRTLEYRTRFTVVQKKVDESLVSLVEVVFRVAFLVTDDRFKITPEQMDQFGASAVNHIVWPYAREFVQDVSLRMGIAGITIPLFHQAFANGLVASGEVNS